MRSGRLKLDPGIRGICRWNFVWLVIQSKLRIYLLSVKGFLVAEKDVGNGVPKSKQQMAEPIETDRFAESALTQAKRQGLLWAVRARWIALAVVAVMLPIVNPTWEVTYYIGLLALFALIGWAQLRIGEVGRSRPELLLLFCDLALMMVVALVPNPLSSVDWPLAMQYRLDVFIFFFVLLAAGTIAYSWRTIVAMGLWTSGLWILGIGVVYFFPNAKPEFTEAMVGLTALDRATGSLLEPNSIIYGGRIQEIVVFLIVAAILALTVKRSADLLISHAALERERTNLARYFSPNVVEELSKNDEPLKQVRTQKVAVLFVDIVGFTAFSDGRNPEDIIHTLRNFHARMETEVFKYGGTLDKYLGDGLMATFGTPIAGDADATHAFLCVQSMMESLSELNRERTEGGHTQIKASFGLHYGTVVLGDIGANRLEFAVIGSTVNMASRLEALTRELGVSMAASDDLIIQIRKEPESSRIDFSKLTERPSQQIRGIEYPQKIWTLGDSARPTLH